MANNNKSSSYVSLKARLKKEIQRRKYTGSITSYAGTAYDYTVVPGNGVPIRTEHHNKLITPIKAINPSGIPNEVKSNDKIQKLIT